MKKIIIIYKTNSGFTKKYSEMIGKELDSKVISLDKANKSMINEYDIIIYGGSLHAVGIIGIKNIKQIMKDMSDKKFIVFAIGASPKKEGILEEIKKNNFSKNKPDRLFYLRGGFNFNRLNLKNKITMFIFINFLKLKSKKSSDEKGMISAYEKPVDFTDKKNIVDLVNYIKKIKK